MTDPILDSLRLERDVALRQGEDARRRAAGLAVRLTQEERERDAALSRATRAEAALEASRANEAKAREERDRFAVALGDLLDAYVPRPDEGPIGWLDRLGMEFYRETRVWPAFKSAPLEMHHEHDDGERTFRWHAWLGEHRSKAVDAARALLSPVSPAAAHETQPAVNPKEER